MEFYSIIIRQFSVSIKILTIVIEMNILIGIFKMWGNTKPISFDKKKVILLLWENFFLVLYHIFYGLLCLFREPALDIPLSGRKEVSTC